MIDVGGGIDVVEVGREEKRSPLDSATSNQQPATSNQVILLLVLLLLVGTNGIHHCAFHTYNLPQLHQENFHFP
jgi:hypothetical protein